MTCIRPPYFLTNRYWYTTPEDEGIDDFFFDDGRGYQLKMMLQKKQNRVI